MYTEEVQEPSENDYNNRQLDLFQGFLCNNTEEREKLSNTIELWDSVPRYSISRRQQLTIRDEKTGTLPIYTIEFTYKGESFRAEIRPAKINDKDVSGVIRTIEYYPSNREELVEDALRKLASQKPHGFVRLQPKEASGVAFSLNGLRIELAERGHAFSYQEIVLSLNILHFSSIDIYKDDKEKTARLSSSYLPVLAAVSRNQIEADSTSKWLVHFHPFITKGITTLAYRQFNYEKMMGLSTQLCRWIHKYLCMKFTQASMLTPPFQIYYKTIKRNSGLLKQKKERENFIDVENALNELKSKAVLADWEKTESLGPRGKKLDTLYKLRPTSEFCREARAANKRHADVTAAALCKKHQS